MYSPSSSSSVQKIVSTFTVIFELAEEGGYIVHVPALPGCHTEGDTFEEAQKNAQEAITAYLLAMKDLHEELPIERQSIITSITTAIPV
jgi:predicted RNase H-like HicB family nuclease